MKLKIFIINLRRSPERHAYMTKQMEGLGLSFEIIDAIDGKTHNFTDEYSEKLYREHNRGTTATDGVKGCALSHRNAMQKMIDEGLDYAIILEDDIELHKNFKSILAAELEKRKSGETNWEYLSFNYPSVGWKSIHLWLFLFFEMVKIKKKSPAFLIKLPLYLIKLIVVSALYTFEGFREFLYKKIYTNGKPALFFRPLYLAGCYLITQEGARKLIDLNTPISYTADGLPNAARIKKSLIHRAYVPLVARQRREEFTSTLFNDHFGKKVTTY